MRTNLSRILRRLPHNLAHNGTDVILQWIEWSGTPTVDPVTGSKTGTRLERTAALKAFLHFVEVATSFVRQFNEVEHGDCIADFAPDAPLDGKEELAFVIGGEKWEQKTVGKRLATTWDVQAQNRKLFRTVLLRKAT